MNKINTYSFEWLEKAYKSATKHFDKICLSPDETDKLKEAVDIIISNIVKTALLLRERNDIPDDLQETYVLYCESFSEMLRAKTIYDDKILGKILEKQKKSLKLSDEENLILRLVHCFLKDRIVSLFGNTPFSEKLARKSRDYILAIKHNKRNEAENNLSDIAEYCFCNYLFTQGCICLNN